MDDIKDQIQRIDDKLQQLLTKHNQALKDVQRLQKENLRLNEQLQSHSEKANQMNRKVTALKVNAGPLHDTAKLELEKRIDTYLKDIDKCLALLHA